MNRKARVPLHSMSAWAAAEELLRGIHARRPGGCREAVKKTHILVIDAQFSKIPRLLWLLYEDGFSVDIMNPGSFTVVAQEMFEDYQLVILDIDISRSIGFDLLRDIRGNTQLPVLVLTALSSQEDRIAGLELGADDYVTKPCRPREVLARIHSLLRRKNFS